MEMHCEIKRNTYQDSMKLMQIQAVLKRIPGVISSGLAMATPQNKRQFKQAGLLTSEIEQAGPNDLCIAVIAESAEGLSSAVQEINNFFSSRKIPPGYESKQVYFPKSLSSAVKTLPQANLAVISVPGDYAAYEASKALSMGLHVFLFSDNVPLEDEIELKELAAKKGLLVMGPDCGTSIISGVPLGLSNAVRRGRIGIVAASGSGLQEVSCLIHRMGEGISQAVGTGGRDLSAEIGGKTFIAAMQYLMEDEETKVMVLMSKHCDPMVMKRIVDRSKVSNKPTVIYYPGSVFPIDTEVEKIHIASNLEHIATYSVALARQDCPPKPLTPDVVEREFKKIIESEVQRFSPKQKYLRALFTGGTFADEAKQVLPYFFGHIFAHPATTASEKLDNPLKSKGNCIVDLGDDFFTRGKVHPIIDPTQRTERISEEIEDTQIRVFLLDVVLGFGCHSDPGGVLSEVILATKEIYREKGNYLSFVVSLSGTEDDLQGYGEQKKKLENSGAIVTASSTQAVMLAGLINSRHK